MALGSSRIFVTPKTLSLGETHGGCLVVHSDYSEVNGTLNLGDPNVVIASSIVLTGDTTIESGFFSGESLKICLNGYKLTRIKDTIATELNANESSNLTIADCKSSYNGDINIGYAYTMDENTGFITVGEKKNTDALAENEGLITGGVITGFEDAIIMTSGTINIMGGYIVGNTGEYVVKANDNFNMTGGHIAGNKVDGAGVISIDYAPNPSYAKNNDFQNMAMSYNSSKGNGGAISIFKGKLTFRGTTFFKYNASNGSGGAINLTSSSINFYGTHLFEAIPQKTVVEQLI